MKRITDQLTRRNLIYTYILRNGCVSLNDLQRLTGASRPTLVGDLDYIDSVMGVPLVRTPGNGGGIKIAETWSRVIVHFNQWEEDVIKKCCNELRGENQKDLLNILLRHCNPENAESIVSDFIDVLEET